MCGRVPYMGRRNYRTEDLQERFDTKFQDVILELKPEKKDIPIGLVGDCRNAIMV